MTPEELIEQADNEAFLAAEAFAFGRGESYFLMRQAEIDAEIKRRTDAVKQADAATGSS